MLTNYIKITLRNFMKHKGYSLINIMGLAIAISVFSIIFIFIKNELSYDLHHANGYKIYKVIEIQMGAGFGTNHVSWTMGPLAASPHGQIGTRSAERAARPRSRCPHRAALCARAGARLGHAMTEWGALFSRQRGSRC